MFPFRKRGVKAEEEDKGGPRKDGQQEMRRKLPPALNQQRITKKGVVDGGGSRLKNRLVGREVNTRKERIEGRRKGRVV